MADRTLCASCRRPEVVCVCAHVHSLPTRTRVLLLQHPKERKVGVGTARIAHLSLPNSLLRVGLDFSGDEVVRATLATPGTVCVLFPRPGALDVSELPRDQPLTLVVLDGTWSLARKLLRLNPALAALPHVAFRPRRPSAYRIRRQPAALCLSTIEALAEVLELIEPERGPFDRLLEPFHAMVERQERFVNEVGAYRHRRAPRTNRPPRRAVLAERLAGVWSRLVCVQGDSNAWPRRDPARQPPEIVHWVAHRPATGETFESVVAPRRSLAPATIAQVELSLERIQGGDSASGWRHAWQRFSRPDDVLVTWGSFYAELAAEEGLMLSAEALDLRHEALALLRDQALFPVAAAETAMGATPAWRAEGTGRLRTVDACAAILGIAPPELGVPGRAGRRLAALTGVLAALAGPSYPVCSVSSSAKRA